MSKEITHNIVTAQTLYACRFQPNGNVFLSNPATDEVWGTDGHTADNYDVALAEEDGSGHYKGDFASGGAIAAGYYYVTVYLQAGADPADSDVAIAQGVINWDGAEEITLIFMLNDSRRVTNVYDETGAPAGTGVYAPAASRGAGGVGACCPT